jgi:hypothetical protein
MECAALLDVLEILDGDATQPVDKGKELLHRIVSMLTRMGERSPDGVKECESAYGIEDENGVSRRGPIDNDNDNEPLTRHDA